MRTLLILVFVALAALPRGTAQQNTEAPPSHPRKVLTPAQQAFQKQLQAFWDQQKALRSQAAQAFDREIAREKAGDCPTANTTYEENLCMGKEVAITDQNLKTYEQALRSFIALQYPTMPGAPEVAAPHVPTSEQTTAEFDLYQQHWHQYLEEACTAVVHQFAGGTGGPSAGMHCHLLLVRDHLRELDAMYDTQLHH